MTPASVAGQTIDSGGKVIHRLLTHKIPNNIGMPMDICRARVRVNYSFNQIEKVEGVKKVGRKSDTGHIIIGGPHTSCPLWISQHADAGSSWEAHFQWKLLWDSDAGTCGKKGLAVGKGHQETDGRALCEPGATKHISILSQPIQNMAKTEMGPVSNLFAPDCCQNQKESHSWI